MKIEDYRSKNLQVDQRVTVLVVVRNEQDKIAQCIHSLLSQNYPSELFEILILDDFSTDLTVDRINKFSDPRIRLVKLSDEVFDKQEPQKKQAIELGIKLAKGNLIMTTDGDCICPPSWIRTSVSFLEELHLNLITGPVIIRADQNSFLERYQELDLVGLVVISSGGGSILSANGANMCFRKLAFLDVNGYQGNRALASGDDLFLRNKIEHKTPGSTRFIKSTETMVQTFPEKEVHSFLQQRIRWAGKIRVFSHFRTRAFLGFMLLYYGMCVLSVPLTFFHPAYGLSVFFIWISKFFADYLILETGCRFTGHSFNPGIGVKSSFFQVLYSLYVGIRILINSRYSWKGRRAG